MITVTAQWWGWLLFVFLLVPVIQFAGWCGDKLGHWAYRVYERRLTEWSRRG